MNFGIRLTLVFTLLFSCFLVSAQANLLPGEELIVPGKPIDHGTFLWKEDDTIYLTALLRYKPAGSRYTELKLVTYDGAGKIRAERPAIRSKENSSSKFVLIPGTRYLLNYMLGFDYNGFLGVLDLMTLEYVRTAPVPGNRMTEGGVWNQAPILIKNGDQTYVTFMHRDLVEKRDVTKIVTYDLETFSLISSISLEGALSWEGTSTGAENGSAYLILAASKSNSRLEMIYSLDLTNGKVLAEKHNAHCFVNQIEKNLQMNGAASSLLMYTRGGCGNSHSGTYPSRELENSTFARINVFTLEATELENTPYVGSVAWGGPVISSDRELAAVGHTPNKKLLVANLRTGEVLRRLFATELFMLEGRLTAFGFEIGGSESDRLYVYDVATGEVLVSYASKSRNFNFGTKINVFDSEVYVLETSYERENDESKISSGMAIKRLL